MHHPFLLLALWSIIGTAAAQSTCPPPQVSVWRNNKPVPPGGAPFARLVRLRVSPGPGCPSAGRYQFTEAEVTPMRDGQPVTPTKLVRQTTGNLSELGRYVRPGDRIHIFVAYDKLVVVAADGTQTPYPRPKVGPNQAKGISFDWLLVNP